ncbi:MAG: Tetratricopeptide repeat protein [Candidatus Hydrogenedentes bacterium]|nr:Tetratricopeptide repeat protein [Candidatus Hydrogenedentota bacterium]
MAGMINCPYCGKLTDPKLENCPYCGGFLQRKSGASKGASSAKSHTCPSCKALVQDGDIICVACGTNLLTGQKIADEKAQSQSRPAARRDGVNWKPIAGGAVGVLVVVALAALVYVLTRDPVQQAVQLSRNGDFLGASAILKKHLDKHPENSEAWFLLGKVNWQTEQFDAAAAAFEKAAELGTANKEAGMMAVLSLASSAGEDALARQGQALERVTGASPDNARAWYLLGLVRGAQNDAAGEVEALQKAFDLAPEDGAIQQNLGIALAKNKLYAEAERALASSNPGGLAAGDLAAVRGFVAYLQKKQDEAATGLTTALQGDVSVRREAAARLGLILVAQGRLNEAATYLAEAVPPAGTEDRIVTFFLGICDASLGKTAEALRGFESVGQVRGPFDVAANIQAAELYLGQGDVERARQAIDRALSFGGSGPAVLTMNGRIYARQENIRQAQEAFKAAIAADATYAPAHLENGLIFVKRQVFPDGVRELEQYLALVPPDAVDARMAEIQALVDQLKQTMEERGEAPVAVPAALERRPS